MFKEALEWQHVLVPKLKEFNEGIDWYKVLERASEMNDEEALEKLFKPKLWTAKNIENEQKNYFLYYTALLKPLRQITSVLILSGTPNDIPEELRQYDATKESCLKRLLTLWHIPYSFSNTDDNANHVVVRSLRDTSDNSSTIVVPLWHYTKDMHSEIPSRATVVDDNDCYTITMSNGIVNSVLLAVKLISLGIDAEIVPKEVKKFKFL